MSSQRLSPPSLPLPLQSRSTPAPPHPFGADARCVPCKILNNAIRSVLTESGKRPRSTTSDEVSELLDLVASAIHLAWFAASPAVVVRPKVDPRIHSALGRRFLELLRSEVVEGWRDFNLPDSELLPLLVAMERVRVTIQPNWAQTFAQQLSVHDERLGHPVALSRVLLNLTTNALKFTDQGYVEVVAQEVGDGNRVEFAVRDSGRGIPPGKVTTLFQPLRQESGRRGQLFSQTGLGLTICRKLVSAMKSELKVESRIGWGTRFFFELDLLIVRSEEHTSELQS